MGVDINVKKTVKSQRYDSNSHLEPISGNRRSLRRFPPGTKPDAILEVRCFPISQKKSFGNSSPNIRISTTSNASIIRSVQGMLQCTLCFSRSRDYGSLSPQNSGAVHGPDLGPYLGGCTTCCHVQKNTYIDLINWYRSRRVPARDCIQHQIKFLYVPHLHNLIAFGHM